MDAIGNFRKYSYVFFDWFFFALALSCFTFLKTRLSYFELTKLFLDKHLVNITLGLSFGLGACTPRPPDDTLPFETIEQTDWAGTEKPYELREPNLVIISRSEEVDHLNGWITDEARDKLLAVDYSDYFALLVLQGLKPSTDYQVSIDRITRIESIVSIYAEFIEPKPDISVGAMETSPYHLVKVKKTGSWGQEITFNLFASGTLVASKRFPGP